MKRRIYIVGMITVFLVLAVGSCRKAGTWLVKAENPEHADVMVMVMGSIVVLPGDANSTRMEAEIVRDHLARQKDIDTLLIVSAAEHTRRAFNLFRAACHSMDQPPVIYCSPSSYTKFNAEKWWRNKNDIQAALDEYLKLVNFVLFERGELRSGE